MSQLVAWIRDVVVLWALVPSPHPEWCCCLWTVPLLGQGKGVCDELIPSPSLLCCPGLGDLKPRELHGTRISVLTSLMDAYICKYQADVTHQKLVSPNS